MMHNELRKTAAVTMIAHYNYFWAIETMSGDEWLAVLLVNGKEYIELKNRNYLACNSRDRMMKVGNWVCVLT